MHLSMADSTEGRGCADLPLKSSHVGATSRCGRRAGPQQLTGVVAHHGAICAGWRRFVTPRQTGGHPEWNVENAPRLYWTGLALVPWIQLRGPPRGHLPALPARSPPESGGPILGHPVVRTLAVSGHHEPGNGKSIRSDRSISALAGAPGNSNHTADGPVHLCILITHGLSSSAPA